MNNQQPDKWFGISLTKKKAYCLLVFSIIGTGFSILLIFNALEVLTYARNIYEYDISIYYNILLLGFSNLFISLGFMGICGYTVGKIKSFRKYLKSLKTKS